MQLFDRVNKASAAAMESAKAARVSAAKPAAKSSATKNSGTERWNGGCAWEEASEGAAEGGDQ